MIKFGVGQSPTRLEDQRLLIGHGTYTSDINLDGRAFGIVVRSPYAHARIAGIDSSAAKAASGVLAVYTAEDITAAGLKPLRSSQPSITSMGRRCFRRHARSWPSTSCAT